MEYTSCPICHSKSANYYDSENSYIYHKCTTCKSIYLNPRPTKEEREKALEFGMHKGKNILNTNTSFSTKKTKAYKEIIKQFNLSNRIENNTCVLDIGAGNGEFLQALNQSQNLKCHAIEPNLNKQKQLKSLNLELVEDINNGTGYGFVSMLNVFSHLSEPNKTLQQILNALTPKGLLLIRTGDTSLCTPKQHYKPYLAPDHLLFTNRKALEEFLMTNGFSIVGRKIHKSPYAKDIAKSILKYVIGSISWANFRYAKLHRDLWILAQKR